MTLLVTIHDVTPALADECRRLLQLCRQRGILPGLLVVPDWHGEAPLERDLPFVAWLRTLQASGAEIFLHGERHDEIGLRRGWREELRAFGRTAREGEFLTLRHAEARARIHRGLERFARLGLHPIGFVPPAWLAREDGFRAAADEGLAVSEDERTIRLLAADRRIPSPVVRWSARTPLRAYGSVLVARARARLQAAAPVIRIALHPADLRHPACAASIVRELDWWSARRRPTGYAALLPAA
jgi:predicted deacetylase